jgi:aryl-alcohol dehydrogenase-like predicted oxidoreductase
MKYRRLGTAGVNVSELCLGGMTFGEADEKSAMHKLGSDEQTTFRILNRALELGVNFIDTADVYGQDGLSERTLGAWLAAHRRRDEIVLATKFRFTMGTGANKSGASRYRIQRCVEQSLKRLGTDRIDLYQIHMQDINVPEEETLRALDDLVRQGKVLYIGCSNYAAYRLMDSLWLSKSSGLASYVTAQMQYSLAVRDIEVEHVPLCRAKGIGILPWSPLAGGLLSGKYDVGQAAPAGTRLERRGDQFKRYNTDRHRRLLEALRQVATELGSTPSAVSLAWLLAQPNVSSVIFGARTLEQLEANTVASDLVLPQGAIDLLTQASAVELPYPYEFMQSIQGRY